MRLWSDAQSPSFSQRGLGVAPGRHGLDRARRETAGAERRLDRRRVERKLAKGASFDAMMTSRLLEKIDAALRLDEVALGEIVHPIEIGRGEEIGGRALLRSGEPGSRRHRS